MRDKLYLLSGCGPKRVHIVIEQSDNDDFELFFAFKLRFLTNLEERKAFIDYWRSKYEGDFTLFLETLLASYKALFDKAKRISIKKLAGTPQDVISPKAATPSKTAVLPKIINLPDLESNEDPDEIEIDMTRELLTIVLTYYAKFYEIEEKNNDRIRFLSLLIGKELTSINNSQFKPIVPKYLNANRIGEKELSKLKEAAEPFDNVKLTYIADLIRKDIENFKKK